MGRKQDARRRASILGLPQDMRKARARELVREIARVALLGDHDGALGRDGPPDPVQRSPEERASLDETCVLLGPVGSVNSLREGPKPHTLAPASTTAQSPSHRASWEVPARVACASVKQMGSCHPSGTHRRHADRRRTRQGGLQPATAVGVGADARRRRSATSHAMLAKNASMYCGRSAGA